MSESKPQWTPGPWEWNEDHEEILAHRDAAFPTLIADVSMHGAGEANAHLIAAAPDLYEALENLLDVTGAPPHHRGFAALAKARGQETP